MRRATVVLAMGAVAVGGLAHAAIPDTAGVIHGCYRTNGGSLRVIDTAAGGTCIRSETPIQWNQQGPIGPRGPQGPPGSDAEFNGAAAGGHLRGTYPNPRIADGVLTPSMLVIGSVPAASAYAFNQTVFPGDGNYVVLPLPSEDFDTQSMHDTAGNNQRIVAPITGLYQVNAKVRWSGGTVSNGYHSMRVHTLGPRADGYVAEEQVAQIEDVHRGNVQNGSALVRLNAGDHVRLEVAHSIRNPQGATGELSLHWVAPITPY